MKSYQKNLKSDFKSKEYRRAFVEAEVGNVIAYQIRAMRDARGWSQGKLAEKLNTSQSNISARLENPDYGKWGIQMLLEAAAAFDVALLVRFVSFGEFIARNRDTRPGAMSVDEFNFEQFDTSIPRATSGQQYDLEAWDIAAGTAIAASGALDLDIQMYGDSGASGRPRFPLAFSRPASARTEPILAGAPTREIRMKWISHKKASQNPRIEQFVH